MNPSNYIPTPCPEDVNCMPGNDQQSFCAKCNKHVHNLTNHTDEQIRALDKKYKGNLCGYFRLALGTTAVSLAACTTPVTKNETSHHPTNNPEFSTPPPKTVTLPPCVAGGIRVAHPTKKDN